MRRSTGSRNPMITGGSNMLSSTSGPSARKPTAGQSYAKGLMDKMMGENEVSHIDPAQARQQMASRDFQLTPSGQQMGRFQQLAAIRANPGQSGYAQMMAQAGQQTQQPQGMYPGSKAANEHSQGKLAEYAQQGGTGMNIMQRQDGKYALTSLGNQRGKSANSLTGGKIEVYENGSEASLGDPSGQTYQIDANTLPNYRAGAARQQKRRQNAKEANGGLASRDVEKLSKIEQMVASGRTTKPQAAAQLRKMQGRHGLANNGRVQSVIDRMENKTKGSDTGRKSGTGLAQKHEAFFTPRKNKYSENEVKASQERVAKFSQNPAMDELGINAESDVTMDVTSLLSRFDEMSENDLLVWASMVGEKRAASNNAYINGKPLSSYAGEISDAVDAGDYDKLPAIVERGKAAMKSARTRKSSLSPTDLAGRAGRTLLDYLPPVSTNPNVGKF